MSSTATRTTIGSVLILVMIIATGAGAAVPQLINYQGILIDGAGDPVPGPIEVVFAIWDQPTDGDSLWSEARVLMPDPEGRITVLLGVGSEIPDSAFAGDAYLSVKAGLDPEMSPRSPLVSVGYSYRVGTIDGAAGGEVGGTIVLPDEDGDTLTIDPEKIVIRGAGGDVEVVYSSTGMEIYTDEPSMTALAREPQVKRKRVMLTKDSLIFYDASETPKISITSVGGVPSIIVGDPAESYELPTADGNIGQVMVTDGAGTVDWADPSGNTVWTKNVTRVYLTNGGDSVGIGTASPGEKLDVFGNIHASGTITSGNSIVINGITDVISGDGGMISFDDGMEISATGGTISFADDILLTNGKASFGWNNNYSGGGVFVAGGNNSAIGDSSAIGGGNSNVASNFYSTVGGGLGNRAFGQYATIGGGYYDTASANYATIAGGRGNTAGNIYATVGGGRSNIASRDYATVGGGQNNTASGSRAAVSGGNSNVASGDRSTVGGGVSNAASNSYTTVGGGYGNTATGNGSAIGGGRSNTASLDYATVGGGYGNTASESRATVGGGEGNTASGSWATVGGGVGNTASGLNSTIPGGYLNEASGQNSFAAGRRAKARDNGQFVWADNNDFDFPTVSESNFTPTASMFLVRATDGAIFVTGIDLAGNSTSGVELAGGGGSWQSLSDRNLKENIEAVDGSEILAKIADLPISTWNYKAQDESIRHIGPMAQDLYAAFGLGEDERHITTIDGNGIALAAIQELHKQNLEQQKKIAKLQDLVEKLLAERE